MKEKIKLNHRKDRNGGAGTSDYPVFFKFKNKLIKFKIYFLLLWKSSEKNNPN